MLVSTKQNKTKQNEPINDWFVSSLFHSFILPIFPKSSSSINHALLKANFFISHSNIADAYT
jgi:hypothetical protein